MDWTSKCETKTYKSIEDFPEKTIGFIYLIEFTDGSKYLGKKELYSVRTLEPLKSGIQREGGTFTRRKKKGVFIPVERVVSQSNWLKYQGSSIHCKGLTPLKKTILALASNKLELTYLEVREQFIYKVLEDYNFLNENILGKFYKGKFDNLKD